MSFNINELNMICTPLYNSKNTNQAFAFMCYSKRNIEGFEAKKKVSPSSGPSTAKRGLKYLTNGDKQIDNSGTTIYLLDDGKFPAGTTSGNNYVISGNYIPPKTFVKSYSRGKSTPSSSVNVLILNLNNPVSGIDSTVFYSPPPPPSLYYVDQGEVKTYNKNKQIVVKDDGTFPGSPKGTDKSSPIGIPIKGPSVKPNTFVIAAKFGKSKNGLKMDAIYLDLNQAVGGADEFITWGPPLGKPLYYVDQGEVPLYNANKQIVVKDDGTFPGSPSGNNRNGSGVGFIIRGPSVPAGTKVVSAGFRRSNKGSKMPAIYLDLNQPVSGVDSMIFYKET